MRTSKIQADYRRSVERVYREATIAVFEHECSLDILACCDFTYAIPDRFPTWVVHWNRKREFKVADRRLYDDGDLYNASAGHLAAFEHDRRRLLASGIQLFRLDLLSQYLPDHETSSWIPRIAGVRKQIMQWIHNRTKATSLETEDTFGRTLLEDKAYSRVHENVHRLGPANEFDSHRFYLGFPTTLWSYIIEAADGHPPGPDDEEQFQWTVKEHALGLDGVYFAVGPLGECCMIRSQPKAGDVVYIVGGCSLPWVLHQVPGTSNEYQIVGAVYVHGKMDGEAPFEDPQWLSTGKPDCITEAFEPIILV